MSLLSSKCQDYQSKTERLETVALVIAGQHNVNIVDFLLSQWKRESLAESADPLHVILLYYYTFQLIL